ncbi:hypothetical protein ILUMI_05626 [Ignelater luminosus]|uniref:Uncharacterized protein n=1 Tax=Ignelater luminosus TaxID=2038154 RepID=A0A8K0GDD7_IGNLU|nr:hypothetical protein ILUMI_05626 [Ignelater luminosus]
MIGHEECESCEEFNLHNPDHNKENFSKDCNICGKWRAHIEKAKKAIDKYHEDAEKDDKVIYCVDLEKVIMIPRWEMFKSAIFTHRLMVYNESFVPVGKKQKIVTHLNKFYDFQDFVSTVKGTSKTTEVLTMELSNFHKWVFYLSQYKLNKMVPRPYIHNIVHIKIEQGSFNMKYESDYDGEFFDINFLSSKVTKNNRHDLVNGISALKKENIMKNLSGVMKNHL